MYICNLEFGQSSLNYYYVIWGKHFYMVPNWTSIMSIDNIIMRTLYYKIRTYFLGIKIEKANGSLNIKSCCPSNITSYMIIESSSVTFLIKRISVIGRR